MTATPARDLIGAYLDSELNYEWQRKASFETRAFAIASGNVGLATLFVALDTQFEFVHTLHFRGDKALIVSVLGFAILSTLAAILSAIPYNYPTINDQAIDVLLREVIADSVDDVDVQEQIIEVRLKQVAGAARANSLKAVASVVAFACLGASAVAIIAVAGLAVAPHQ